MVLQSTLLAVKKSYIKIKDKKSKAVIKPIIKKIDHKLPFLPRLEPIKLNVYITKNTCVGIG